MRRLSARAGGARIGRRPILAAALLALAAGLAPRASLHATRALPGATTTVRSLEEPQRITQATVVAAIFDAALGHNIADLRVPTGATTRLVAFLDFFRQTGGIERWGHAVSEPLVENGVLCQYFQRGVLEWAPLAGELVLTRRLAWDFLGGGLGGAPDFGVEPGSFNPQPGLPVGPFEHSVSNWAVDGTRTGFLDFFQRLGGVQSFGFPKTEARADTGGPGLLSIAGASSGFIRQYFQAAVMEFHPGDLDPVKLRLLGDDLRNRFYPVGLWTLIRSFRTAQPLAAGAVLDLERTERGAGLIAQGAPRPPAGFELTVAADTSALGLPVALGVGPDERLYVCLSSNAIVTYPLRAGSQGLGEPSSFAAGLDPLGIDEPRGVAFAAGSVFASVRSKIIRLRDTSGTGAAGESVEIVTGLPDLPTLLHRNNGIALGPDGKLYLAVGSTSNSGEVPESTWSSAILRVGLDGAGLEIFASGFRNPFDLAFAPTGELFCTDNGPDSAERRLDDPPDELNHVVAGGRYGHPELWGTPPAGSDTRGPVAELPAHAAAAGLTFFTGPQAGAFAGDALIATWGPGIGRSSFAHGILRVRLTPQGDTYTGTAEPFVTGLSRPTDVVVGPHGDLLISDHVGRKIYRLRRR